MVKHRRKRETEYLHDKKRGETNGDVSVNMIIGAFNLSPVPYEYDMELSKWMDSFEETTMASLESANIDIECFKAFQSAVDAHIMDAKSLARRQFTERLAMIHRLKCVINGKIKAFRDKKTVLEAELDRTIERLDLNSKRREMEG